MKIAKFWAQVESTLKTSRAKQLKVHVYGWSDTSQADATACARNRAARISAGSESGSSAWYLYDGRPLREPVVADHSNSTVQAIVTRSRYGATVLNTDKVAFLDIDVYHDNHPVRGTGNRYGFFAKLFGRPDPMVVKLEAIRQWFVKNPTIGMRLYRTPNGYRGILTSAFYTPTETTTERLLTELGCDPLYIRLCREQECFRARLTAKPWRITAPILRLGYPYINGTPESLQQWREIDTEAAAEYDAKASNYAACHFVEQLGNRAAHSAVSSLVTLHDQLSGALTTKPIA